jgi:hypothetical protein
LLKKDVFDEPELEKTVTDQSGSVVFSWISIFDEVVCDRFRSADDL